MDELRKTRYKSKIRYISESIALAGQLLQTPNEIEEKALYYCLFTSIESAMDLIAMLIKDHGNIPKGDEFNIDLLESEDLIDSKLAFHLKSCNRLRNVLVHQYNGVDQEIVLDSFSDVEETLTNMMIVLEKYLNES